MTSKTTTITTIIKQVPTSIITTLLQYTIPQFDSNTKLLAPPTPYYHSYSGHRQFKSTPTPARRRELR